MLSFLLTSFSKPSRRSARRFFVRHGIRLLLMDFDNTMLPYTTDPEQTLLDWIAGMQDAASRLHRLQQP